MGDKWWYRLRNQKNEKDALYALSFEFLSYVVPSLLINPPPLTNPVWMSDEGDGEEMMMEV